MNLDPYRNEIPPRRELLPGGAVLLSTPMRTANSVTLGVWLRTGSQDETPELGGITHFLEHMVFKGTARLSAFELASGFDSIGAAVDAFTTKDLVAFTIRVLPEYFQPAVELLGQMLTEPSFDPRLTALEQDVVIEEIQEALDTPEDRLHDAFARQIYGGHARGRPILGLPAAVRSFDSEVLHREHAHLFRPDNMVISMSGNLQDTYRDLVVKALVRPVVDGPGTVAPPPAETSRPAAVIDTDLDENDPFRLELNSPILQTYFEAGNLGVSYRADDRMPVFLLTNLLGGGMSSRIFQAVREREGLAYTVYNYHDMGRDTGLVSCAGSCSPEKLERIEDVIRMEYLRLSTEGVPGAELDSNRAQLKSQLIFSLEGVVNQMFRAARNEIYYGRFVPVAELVDRIDSVGMDDLMRCAGQHFNPDHLLFATHGPEQKRLVDQEGAV